MTLLSRIIHLEDRVPRVMQAVRADPLPRIIEAVEAEGGKLPGESWAMAAARLAGVTVTQLLDDLRDRARGRNNGRTTARKEAST